MEPLYTDTVHKEDGMFTQSVVFISLSLSLFYLTLRRKTCQIYVTSLIVSPLKPLATACWVNRETQAEVEASLEYPLASALFLLLHGPLWDREKTVREK